jgi:hypothetical protein
MGGIQYRFLQHINPLLTFVDVDSGNGKGVKRKTRVLRFTPLSSIPERFAPSVGVDRNGLHLSPEFQRPSR